MSLRRPRGRRERPVAVFRGSVVLARVVPLGLGYLSVAAGDLTVRWPFGRMRFSRDEVRAVEVRRSRRSVTFRIRTVDGRLSKTQFLPATPFGPPDPAVIIATLRQLNWDVRES